MSDRLFIGNLPYGSEESDLRDYVIEKGFEVRDTAVIKDRETGQSKGFAFVTLGSPEEAVRAIRELNGSEFRGRSLRVNEANKREERKPAPRREYRPQQRQESPGSYEGSSSSSGGRGGKRGKSRRRRDGDDWPDNGW